MVETLCVRIPVLVFIIERFDVTNGTIRHTESRESSSPMLSLSLTYILLSRIHSHEVLQVYNFNQ